VVCGIVVQAITPLDHITEKAKWVDKEQADSFLQEYDRFPDKAQFVRDKQAQHLIILQVCVLSLFCPSA
jgi:hypothetical protein